MALVLADRVKETTSTTGTGSYSLNGASTGFQSFADVLNTSDTTYYTATNGTDFEVGIGTFTSPSTLARTTILSSSNSGNAINFSAGAKDIFITYPAGRSVFVSGSSIVPGASATLPVASGGTGASSDSQARTNLGATTLGANIFGISNPSAVTFPRFNADNTVSSLSDSDFRTAIGAGIGNGTVTSVGGTGTVQGLSLSGTVTGSGDLTLGGSLSEVSLTTQVTGTLPVANGGTGITSFGTGVATFIGTPSSANLAAAVTDETGSGSLVFATSPTLVTPVLGTPTSGDLANCTFPTLNQSTTGSAASLTTARNIGGVSFNGTADINLPGVNQAGSQNTTGSAASLTTARTIGGVSFDGTANINLPGVNQSGNQNTTGNAANVTGVVATANGGTGISSLGTGVATFLGTPSSANLAAAVTDETGTGLIVFATNPTLTGVTLAGEAACADNLVTRAVLKDYAVEGSAIGNTGATRIFDVSTANFFSATLNQACVFTFSNPPASGDFGSFVLELTNGGAYAITYPGSVDFVGGVAPTLTAAGVDQLVFTTRDGGTTYFAFVAGLDIKSP